VVRKNKLNGVHFNIEDRGDLANGGGSRARLRC
jgi:hypothetical protein